MATPSGEAGEAMMRSEPRLLQGVFPFEGHGLESPFPLDERLVYEVPEGREAQLVYFRAGNSSQEIIDLIVLRDSRPMRHFPIGARGDCHVTLAVVEDLPAGTRMEIHIAAPEGTKGTAVIDVGMVEIHGSSLAAW
jgi:assimilatory nitrate reductase catalytic subunit